MKRILLSLVFSVSSLAFADSPLTSTPFFTVYVTECGNKKLDDRTCTALESAQKNQPDYDFFADDTVDLGVRVAVVNAIGWDGVRTTPVRAGQAKAFKEYLEKNSLPMTPSREIVYGYKMAMELYSDLYWGNNPSGTAEVLKALDNGAAQLPGNFAAQIIHIMTNAVVLMSDLKKWQQIRQEFDQIMTAIPANQRNLLPDAVTVISDYMSGY